MFIYYDKLIYNPGTSKEIAMQELFAGTYFPGGGIYRLTLSETDGFLCEPSLFCSVPDSKYLACNGVLASAVAREEGAGICLISESGTMLTQTLCERVAPCYVTKKDGLYYTANYHEGCVRIYDEALGLKKKIVITEGAGCHQALFWKNYLLVPCLKLDCVRLFSIPDGYAPAGEIRFPEESGPRHGVFDGKGRLYVIGELDNTLYTLTEHGGTFEITDGLCLADRKDNASAALRAHPQKDLLYVSTRGADIISVIDTSGTPRLKQQTGSGGRHPRDFVLTADGRFLIVANRDSGDVSAFFIEEDGRVGQAAGHAKIASATAIVLG